MTIKREIEIDIKEEISKMAFSEKYALICEIVQDCFDMQDYINLIKDGNYTQDQDTIARELLDE